MTKAHRPNRLDTTAIHRASSLTRDDGERYLRYEQRDDRYDNHREHHGDEVRLAHERRSAQEVRELARHLRLPSLIVLSASLHVQDARDPSRTSHYETLKNPYPPLTMHVRRVPFRGREHLQRLEC